MNVVVEVWTPWHIRAPMIRAGEPRRLFAVCHRAGHEDAIATVEGAGKLRRCSKCEAAERARIEREAIARCGTAA